ncbi:hypothetical protein ACP275_13G059500 [Erythranthe tilingii]
MEVAKQYSRRRRRNPSISDLPDSILCHILSFLPTTKNTVATSILARRWRYLWSYVPNLIFDSDDDNIDRVLLLHKLQTIDTFRLSENVTWLDHKLEKWISFAVNRNVRTIDVCISGIASVLPRCLFTCKTLVFLRLDSFDEVANVEEIGSGFVFLPLLKKLHLNFIHPESGGYVKRHLPPDCVDGYLPRLLSGCPVLEELVVRLNVYFYPCKISSPTIKRLTIELRCEYEKPYFEDNYYDRLEINTPALVYLQLIDCATQYLKFGALNSLFEADICINGYAVEAQDDFIYARYVVEFIDKLRNVKCLKIDLLNHAKIMDYIDSVFSTWTISFHTLTKLELVYDCRFLSKFLESAHNLETLILNEVWYGIEGWMEPQQVPTCLLSRLRIIKTVDILSYKYKFNLLRCLLRNGQVLERMEIVYPDFIKSEQKMYMLQEMSLFERGSRACEVAFVQYNHKL